MKSILDHNRKKYILGCTPFKSHRGSLRHSACYIVSTAAVSRRSKICSYDFTCNEHSAAFSRISETPVIACDQPLYDIAKKIQ